MVLKKKDFIEIEFTGKVKDGEIFDSNIKSDLSKTNLNQEPKPFVFCLGEGMFLKSIDEFLIGKDIGKYEIELEPEKAFGNRNPKLVQIMPMRVFAQQKVNPVPGMMFNFDGRIAKILTVSGGRVITDFNNPIAGKIVQYKIIVKKKIEDLNEKIKAFINFLFRRDLKFEVKDKKIVIEVEKQTAKFVGMFAEKFKDVFDKKLEVKEVEEKTKTPSKSQ
jgi:FKBP-type peptidyl-prolyl cis-trans isomerase 2